MAQYRYRIAVKDLAGGCQPHRAAGAFKQPDREFMLEKLYLPA
jgi:hypothetical protein